MGAELVVGVIAAIAIAGVCVIAGWAVGQLENVNEGLRADLAAERDRHRQEVAELLNRYQFPTVYQPTPEQEATIRRDMESRPPPAQDDAELGRIGRVFHGGDESPDVWTPPDGAPIPQGE